MGMIGNQPAAGVGSISIANDSFNGTGAATSFTLSQTVSATTDIEVIVDNVQQSPYDGSYSVSGTTLTFSGAPAAGTNNIYVIYNHARTITTQQQIPDDGSVTHSKLHTNALDPIKLSGNNVGIGTSSPNKPLHVDGGTDYNVVLRSADTRSGMVIYSPDTGALDTSVGSVLVTTDGLFRLGTSTHYNIVMHQDGGVTKPRHPVCYGRLSNNGAQATNTVSSLQALYDPRSMVNTATAGAHKIVVPTAGVYEIKAAQLCDPVNTYVYFYIRVNGSYIYHAHNNMMTSSNNMDHRVNCNWSLAANDTVDFYYVGAATNVWNGNHSYFSVSLIG